MIEAQRLLEDSSIHWRRELPKRLLGSGVTPDERREAKKLLESSGIVWARDFDALLVGLLIGFLLGKVL